MTEDYPELHEKIDKILHNPKNLSTESELKEHANSAIAAFRAADVDNSGSLSIPELVSLCSHMGLPMEDDEEEALMKIDADDSGQISMEEWITWWLRRVSCLPNPLKQQEAIARTTFRKFDIDESGNLDVYELRELLSNLGANFSEEEVLDAVNELDEDGSGTIEENEFIDWWVQRSMKNRLSGGLIAMKLRKLARKAAQIFYTDIFTAVWNNDIEMVKTFLESDRRIGSASDDSEYGEGWMPLHYASYKGYISICDLLITSGNINAINNHGFTPLFYACQNGHLDICRLLLEKGADPGITGGSTISAFMCPVDHCQDNKELIKIFKSHQNCVPPRKPPSDKMRATLNENKNSILVELPPLKTFSLLPVKKWNIVVHSSSYKNEKNDENSFKITVNGLDPNKPKDNILEVSVDKKWLNKALISIDISPDLTVKLSATNSLEDESPFTDFITVKRDNGLTKNFSMLSVIEKDLLGVNPDSDYYDEDNHFDEKENDNDTDIEKDDKKEEIFHANDETIERLRREINGEDEEEDNDHDDENYEDEDELHIVQENAYK